MAPERVGADGSGSPSSRRSCGAPGTSGQCQARGLDPAGARRIFSPQACGFSLPGNGALPSPHGSFGGYGDLGKGKIKVLSPLGGEQELELPVPLTLKKGRKALTTSCSCEMEIEGDPLHSRTQAFSLRSALRMSGETRPSILCGGRRLITSKVVLIWSGAGTHV